MAARPRYQLAIGLGLILWGGALARLYKLDYRTLNHPEVYAPGIDLPWQLSNPNPRFTLWQTLAGSISGEPHPPGYYILMLGWTDWFGSSIVALRLPSVLFGVGSVLLTYVLARRTENALTGLFAASMLALNGQHVYVSQTARMYSMACFLGLLSTVLLIAVVRSRSRQHTFRALYAAFTVAALATHVYVWALFAAQGLWTTAAHLRGPRSLLGVLRLQLLIFVLASPLVAIAAYQVGAASRPPTLAPWDGLVRFLQFGSLFELYPPAGPSAAVKAAAAVAVLASAVLVASAVRRNRSADTVEDGPGGDAPGFALPHARAMATLGATVCLVILAFAYVAKMMRPGRSVGAIVVASALPLVLVAVDALLCGSIGKSTRLRMLVRRVPPGITASRSLILCLAFVPVCIVAATSLVSPIFIQRGTVVFAPYLLIVLATGLVFLIRLDRRWLLIALIVAAVHVVSLRQFQAKSAGPDYKGLAERLVPHIERSDLIFVYGRGHPFDWKVAPIFYYLNAREYHFVGRDFGRVVEKHPRSRVWLLSFPSIPPAEEAVAALAGYEARTHIEAREIRAELYVGRDDGHTAGGSGSS